MIRSCVLPNENDCGPSKRLSALVIVREWANIRDNPVARDKQSGPLLVVVLVIRSGRGIFTITLLP